MATIQVQEVSKRYGQKRLFTDVTVTFSSGRRYGMTGPNGAGKSTFLKILSGDLEPDTGSVHRPQRTGGHPAHRPEGDQGNPKFRGRRRFGGGNRQARG